MTAGKVNAQPGNEGVRTMPLKKIAYARAGAIEEIERLVAEAAGKENLQIEVNTPGGGFGDFSTPACFSLAKEMRKSPNAIAQELAGKINSAKKKFVSSASGQGGYLNLRASEEFFSLSLRQALEMGAKFGSGGAGRGKLFAIDYSDPNVGKPFHVGHIRSTILGESIKRLRKFSGWKTFGYCYLGDAGTQVAKLVVALDEFSTMSKAQDEKELLEYYVRIHEETQKRPELEQKARKSLELIEAGDKQALGKVAEIKKISLRGFEKNWKTLEVKFDLVTGESQFIEAGRDFVSECLRKGIASRDEGGAVILELEGHGIPNTVIMREGGTTLYLSREAGMQQFMFDKVHYDESLVITASEQNTHFKQLYKAFELLGREYARKVRHLGFGLVFLAEGKISSREGRVVFLDDVLNEAVEAARQEIASRELDYSKKDVEEIAKAVGIGSVKFAFLKVSNEKNITFDSKAATRFDGDTGAYLQYTAVRAENILRKASGQGEKVGASALLGETERKKGAELGEVERRLCGKIAEFPAAVEAASSSFQPHTLCEYLLRLSADFGEFYEKCPVLSVEDGGLKRRRLALVKATAGVLKNGLELLGIGVPEKM